jgi:two-component system heavy metal sensor histidine kinase CusS
MMHIDIPEETTVNADRGLLEIILDNLISNAIKYNHHDGNIVCQWNQVTKSLSVADKGPGIPREQIPLLFDRFYRTDASRSSKVQGNGLGLSIVKKLADLQQIGIGIISKPGEGTIFTLQFNS